jgi:hypothetical protein
LGILQGGSRKVQKEHRHSKQESWRIFGQGISDTENARRLHKILAKDPGVRFGSLLLTSREYMSSGEEALKLLLETHSLGSEVLNDEDIAQRSLPGVPVQGTGNWALTGWVM